ncbi:MAG: twin-arginine translocase TatA/TatE family subunit [Bacteriovorax sp.]|nr:twin-arginine translocase TatA/TatE family subunit [Bacteriovorax sp.]
MFGLGAGELFLILGVCVLFFGPKKIPQLAKGMGEAIREFQKSKNEALEEPTKISKKG